MRAIWRRGPGINTMIEVAAQNAPGFPHQLFGDKPLFHTRDLDEAREGVGSVYTSHDLDYKRLGRKLDTYFYHIPLPESSVNYLGYGSDMVVNPGELEDFFLVQTPIRGGGVTIR